MIEDVLTLYGAKEGICKTYSLPGDKSIAHRALIIGGLPTGEYKVFNYPNNKDCAATLKVMMSLGLEVNKVGQTLFVKSPGYDKFKKYVKELDCENSGTTARLISGILAALSIEGKLIGDNSLSKRPMGRVITPLKDMGANITSLMENLPLIFGRNEGLKGIEYHMPVASAQVKSCLLIAGFLSKDTTIVWEKLFTRDHTEKMFKHIGAKLDVNGNKISIKNSKIEAKDIYVPGDISSAAFLISLALLGEKNFIKIEKISLNERRRKYLEILKEMGADINYTIDNIVNNEEIGAIEVKSSKLKGVTIEGEIIPYIIDEIPMLSVLAAFSEGKTIIKSVEELKYKESNRIEAIINNLHKCGVNSYFSSGDLIIEGGHGYLNQDVAIESFNDHRIAMSFLGIAMRNLSKTIINGWSCSEISFPEGMDYFKDFLRII